MAEYLRIFERKILRKIYEPRLENGIWIRRTNKELMHLIKNKDIVRYIKSQRIRWLGHVHRSDESNIIKKITMCKLFNSNRIGRPREIWIDNVEKDLDKTKIRNWNGLALKPEK